MEDSDNCIKWSSRYSSNLRLNEKQDGTARKSK